MPFYLINKYKPPADAHGQIRDMSQKYRDTLPAKEQSVLIYTFARESVNTHFC